MVEYYKKISKPDGSQYFAGKRKCPFSGFKECLGEKCSLFSITGFTDNKGVQNDYGECALVKLPGFLIDVMRLLKELKGK